MHVILQAVLNVKYHEAKLLIIFIPLAYIQNSMLCVYNPLFNLFVQKLLYYEVFFFWISTEIIIKIFKRNKYILKGKHVLFKYIMQFVKMFLFQNIFSLLTLNDVMNNFWPYCKIIEIHALSIIFLYMIIITL